MIGWIRRWRQNRARALFRYFDGRRWRRADPFRLWRKLFTTADVNLLDLLALADQGKEPETTQAIEFLCRVFGVERFDDRTGQGLTDWEVLGLLTAFHAYLESLKKSTSPGPTSPPPGDWPSSTSPEPPSQAMSGPLDFGSAPAGPTPAGPGPSSAACAGP